MSKLLVHTNEKRKKIPKPHYYYYFEENFENKKKLKNAKIEINFYKNVVRKEISIISVYVDQLITAVSYLIS